MPKYKPYKTRNRFYVQWENNEWQTVDDKNSTLIGFPSKNQANQFASFCRDYVKRHGDIDLASVPYSWDQPLHYAENTAKEDRLMKVTS